MKKIFILAACVLTLASCADHAKKPALYCEQDVTRLYNNPEAEMDTLSYAAGMNLGLVLSIQNADFDIDVEKMIAILDKELAKPAVEQEYLDDHNKFLGEFSNARVRPYMMAKQRNARIVTDCPDTLSLPAIYDETYTMDRFFESFGAMMANSVRQQRLPVNLHWVYKAMRDAANVTDKSEIDSIMLITEQQLISVMSSYMQQDLPNYNAELAKQWYERVATKEGVQPMLDKNEKPTGVYYRINNPGSEGGILNFPDSIAVKYAVYSRTGKLLESNQTFVDNLMTQREQVLENKMMNDSIRNTYLKQIDQEIANSVIRKLPLNRFMQRDVQEAIKLIGKGGSVTMWLDASRAFGYRASRILPSNEGVVVNVELLDVKSVKPTITPRTVSPSKSDNAKKASATAPLKKLEQPKK